MEDTRKGSDETDVRMEGSIEGSTEARGGRGVDRWRGREVGRRGCIRKRYTEGGSDI